MSITKTGLLTIAMLLLLCAVGPAQVFAEELQGAGQSAVQDPQSTGQTDVQSAPAVAQPVAQGGHAAKLLNEEWSSIRLSIKSTSYDDLQAALKNIEGRCLDLGVSSFEELSAAMVKEGVQLQDAGNMAFANALFDSARRISPNYPPSYYASGWSILAQNKLKALSAIDMFFDGFRCFWNDFRWSFYYTGNKTASLLFTLAILYSLFGFFIAIRYTQLLAHDISEALNKPDIEGRLKYLLIPALYILVLLVLGYWWAVAVVFLSLWIYFNRKEKALAVMFFLLLVFMPDIMGRVAGFVQSGGNRLLWVMDEVNKGQIQTGAKEYLEGELGKDPDNKWALMSLARIAKVQGRYGEAEALYLKLAGIAPESSIVRNNLANVYFIEGKNELAVNEYKAAIEYQPAGMLPYFNMSQVYSESLMFTERDNADRKASQLDPSGAAFLREKAGDTPLRMVFDEQIPVNILWSIAFKGASSGRPLAGSLWSTTVGVLPLQGARAAGIGFVVLIIGIGALRKNRVFSHYCQKCGKVSCKACQKPTYSKDLCAQCNQIFVKLDGVEARDRVRKMLEIREIHRKDGLINRVASLLLPGAGHFLMGNPITGFLFSGVFIFIIKDLFFGEFFEVPYLFEMPFINPSTVLMVAVLVFVYVIAQLDSNRITKKRDILWH